MSGVIRVVWIPVVVSYIEITCHNYGIVQVDDVLIKEMESILIAIGINVDDEVCALVSVEG